MSDFYVNPVVGVRTWNMNVADLGLEALTSRESWPVHEPLISRHHQFYEFRYGAACPPGRPCASCGIWAFDNYASVESHRANVGHPWPDYLKQISEVRGLVAGWGTVHLATKGWRAGKAYPLALFEWTTPPESVWRGAFFHAAMHATAERYGIPVITADEISELLSTTGCVLPRALKDH